MYLLYEFRETVRIAPHLFNRKFDHQLTYDIDQRLANKVLHNLGLCIALWDIKEIGKSFVLPGDGAAHTSVTYRYVVFRPFIDEILIGRVKCAAREGLTVTLGFFDDILIPATYMQEPSYFDESEQLWVWEYKVDDQTHKLFVDIGEAIRFKVVENQFEEVSPTATCGGGEAADAAGALGAAALLAKAPYTIIVSCAAVAAPLYKRFAAQASIAEPGLGLLSWWTNS